MIWLIRFSKHLEEQISVPEGNHRPIPGKQVCKPRRYEILKNYIAIFELCLRLLLVYMLPM